MALSWLLDREKELGVEAVLENEEVELDDREEVLETGFVGLGNKSEDVDWESTEVTVLVRELGGVVEEEDKVGRNVGSPLIIFTVVSNKNSIYKAEIRKKKFF